MGPRQEWVLLLGRKTVVAPGGRPVLPPERRGSRQILCGLAQARGAHEGHPLTDLCANGAQLEGDIAQGRFRPRRGDHHDTAGRMPRRCEAGRMAVRQLLGHDEAPGPEVLLTPSSSIGSSPSYNRWFCSAGGKGRGSRKTDNQSMR